MLDRFRKKVRELGVKKFSSVYWDRYFKHPIERSLFPNKLRTYEFQRNIAVCMPALSEKSEGFIRQQLAELEEFAKGSAPIELSIPCLAPYNPAFSSGILKIEKIPIDDELVLLGMISSYKNLIFDPSQEGSVSKKMAEILLNKLNITPSSSAKELAKKLRDRPTLKITGPVKHTFPIYEQIAMRISEGHYDYKEPLSWDIIAELPRKFQILSDSTIIDAQPLASLFVGQGRVARQFGVGGKYGEKYFQGESLLDVACDLCGIKRYVGKNTRYVGADIQGLADHYLNLDKEDLPFEPKSFETVLCFEALEHLQDIHHHFDRMMQISRKYVVGSLYIESGNTDGRSITRFGDPIGNAHLPIAPIFDRHQWIFTFTDALDFIYYRARKSGFGVSELNLYYDDKFSISDSLKQKRLLRAFKRGNIKYLSKHVTVLGFVLEREKE